MTLSEIIKEMQSRHPTLIVAAHMETLKLLMEAEQRMFDLHDRIAALETGQSTVERRKPGRPRKNLEANPG